MNVVSTAYIAASANRHPYGADISSSSLAAFGSSNLVALWDIADSKQHGVSETLTGHDGLVTCVKFISDASFASADDSGALILWRNLASEWKQTCMVRAHAKAISSLSVLGDQLVTGSSDASVKVWKLIPVSQEADDLFEEQSIDLRGRFPLSLALSYLPLSKALILAIGKTDSTIQIWTRSNKLFSHGTTLLGHEDWVKALQFLACNDGQSLVLSSGSQDATIRLWDIKPWTRGFGLSQGSQEKTSSDDLLDASEAFLVDAGESEEGGRQILLKSHVLTVKFDQSRIQQFSITFDALLVGHEAGITSLVWRPPRVGSGPTLLSTSTDSSMILWTPSDFITHSPDGANSIWINHQRFGDVGGQRLGGFIGGGWARQGNEALAWGWAGGWRRWVLKVTPEQSCEEVWSEAGAVSGHNGSVQGLDWSPSGNYLISAGLDQTTRIHGAIPSPEFITPTWHEIARPQVHGYDLLDVAFIDPLRFVSIADEKVARVFEAPSGFVDLVNELGIGKFTETGHHRPLAASVPPLGLSNKATNARDQNVPQPTSNRRPFEGELALVTLWPEAEKVFGHGYESMALAVSPRKRLVATSCKATTPEHAAVRVYDTAKFHPVGQPLDGHALTITKIAFSPDDNYLLTVSRDRSWRLFAATEKGFEQVATDKSHARIIWDCAWAAEGDVFATASRDKTVKIWQEQKKKWQVVETIKMDGPATAIAFAPGNSQYRRRLAIGLENGEIFIYSSTQMSPAPWRLDLKISSKIAHVKQVLQLSWQPTEAGPSDRLASCSEDGTLKITIVQMARGGHENSNE